MREPPTRVDVQELDELRILRMPRELSARAEHALEPAIRQALDGPARFLVVDFAAVQTCDSAGIGLLFDLLQRARAEEVRVALAAVGGQPRMVLERVRLPRYVPMFATVDEAVTSVREET